jgi:anti-anti-sigma factor
MPSVPRSSAGFNAGLVAAFVCHVTHDESDAACIQLRGELDLATAPRLERVLGDAERRGLMIVVDLRGLAFIDVSGVHVIAAASVRARSAGRALLVVRDCSQVDRVFRLTGAGEVAQFVDLAPAEPPIQALVHASKGILAA